MENKIGCALVTCNRPDFYKKSVTSLLNAVQNGKVDEYVIVNDGTDKLPWYPVNFIETEGKRGVAVAKNLAFKYLLEQGCEHIFIMEDDIEIVDDSIFQRYIETSKYLGIEHFNFALHGNGNLKIDGSPNFRKKVKCLSWDICLYPNVLGAFSYYSKRVLEEVGLMDETFYNAMEHVDHTYQIAKKEFTTPFRWFIDIADSNLYLKDIVPDHQQSVIRNENFQEVFKRGLDRFIEKNGFSVVPNYGPSEILVSQEDCENFLKRKYREFLKRKYHEVHFFENF